MKCESITICVGENALNFLKITLPQNIKFFDHYIVLTSPDDINTIRFCSAYDITLVITDAFYINGCKFNKGAAYNQAFNVLKYKEWIKILDVDSFISNKLGKYLNESSFDKEYFYSSRRVIVPKYYDFNMLCNWEEEYEKQLENCLGCGWGYDQQFHYDSAAFKQQNRLYPNSHWVAESDWRFRNVWGEPINNYTENSGLLREVPLRIYHLGEPNIDGGHKFFN